MSRIRLLLLGQSASQPSPYLILDGHGEVVGRGALSIGDPVSPEPMRTVVIAPGTDVLVRWLDLPGREAQVTAAAIWALRDELAVPADRVRVALGPVPTPGLPRLVAVANSALIEAWADYVEALGLKADIIFPDNLVLPVSENDTIAAMTFGSLMALRGQDLAVTCEPDLAPLLVGDRPIFPIDDTLQVERILVAGALNPPLNLLGRSRAGESRVGWKIAAALAAALVVSPLVLAAAQAGRDEMVARQFDSRADAVMRAAFPDAGPEADPAAEVRRRLAGAPIAQGVSAPVAALYAAVESVEGAELDALTADPDAGLRATVSYANFGDMEALKTAMTAAGYTLVDESALEDQGRIVSDIIVGGGA